MSLMILSVEEMVQISSAWVQAKHPASQALAKQPLLASLLPEIQEAHAAIFAVRPTPESPRRAEIAAEAARLDGVHDTLVRGLYDFLTGSSLLSDDGSVYIALRDRLLPDGVSGAIHRTYRAQAGYAALLRERLTKENEAELAKLKLGSKSVGDAVEEWLQAAEKLGKLEDERARLDDQQTPTEAGQTNTARLRWIRAVNALISLAELAELTDDERRIIFGSLSDARDKAERRSARRNAASATEPAPVTEPTTSGASTAGDVV